MKAVALIGEPGVGKSTLMRNFIKALGKGHVMKFRKLRFIMFNGPSIIVLGEYFSGKQFEGTDTLSNVVIEDAILFLRSLNKKGKMFHVVFEGDRLNNRTFLDFLSSAYELSIIKLVCDPMALESRITKRGTNQTMAFRNRIKTKIGNLTKEYDMKTIDSSSMDEKSVFRNFVRESGLIKEVVQIGNW